MDPRRLEINDLDLSDNHEISSSGSDFDNDIADQRLKMRLPKIVKYPMKIAHSILLGRGGINITSGLMLYLSERRFSSSSLMEQTDANMFLLDGKEISQMTIETFQKAPVNSIEGVVWTLINEEFVLRTRASRRAWFVWFEIEVQRFFKVNEAEAVKILASEGRPIPCLNAFENDSDKPRDPSQPFRGMTRDEAIDQVRRDAHFAAFWRQCATCLINKKKSLKLEQRIQLQRHVENSRRESEGQLPLYKDCTTGELYVDYIKKQEALGLKKRALASSSSVSSQKKTGSSKEEAPPLKRKRNMGSKPKEFSVPGILNFNFSGISTSNTGLSSSNPGTGSVLKMLPSGALVRGNAGVSMSAINSSNNSNLNKKPISTTTTPTTTVNQVLSVSKNIINNMNINTNNINSNSENRPLISELNRWDLPMTSVLTESFYSTAGEANMFNSHFNHTKTFLLSIGVLTPDGDSLSSDDSSARIQLWRDQIGSQSDGQMSSKWSLGTRTAICQLLSNTRPRILLSIFKSVYCLTTLGSWLVSIPKTGPTNEDLVSAYNRLVSSILKILESIDDANGLTKENLRQSGVAKNLMIFYKQNTWFSKTRAGKMIDSWRLKYNSSNNPVKKEMTETSAPVTLNTADDAEVASHPNVSSSDNVISASASSTPTNNNNNVVTSDSIALLSFLQRQNSESNSTSGGINGTIQPKDSMNTMDPDEIDDEMMVESDDENKKRVMAKRVHFAKGDDFARMLYFSSNGAIETEITKARLTSPAVSLADALATPEKLLCPPVRVQVSDFHSEARAQIFKDKLKKSNGKERFEKGGGDVPSVTLENVNVAWISPFIRQNLVGATDISDQIHDQGTGSLPRGKFKIFEKKNSVNAILNLQYLESFVKLQTGSLYGDEESRNVRKLA